MYPICKPRSVPRQPGITRRVDSPTPLHYAAADGDVATVNALLAGGADPNATAYFGMTPLHLVVQQYAWRRRGFRTADRWAECARLLLEGGANPLLRCHPDTTPAGLGEGFVPPALRDSMIALSSAGVWLDDARASKNEDPTTMQTSSYGGRIGPAPRLDATVGISEDRLSEIKAIAALMEDTEMADRSAPMREHTRIGWWTTRSSKRLAHEPKRKRPYARRAIAVEG